jgi:DNA-binding NtrC family response regulator
MSTIRPIRIMVVDDDASMTRLVKTIIKSNFGAQITTITATDPKVASALLESELVDIVITDLEMPGLSGLDLLRIAKQRNAWTQVILVTAHSACSALTEAMELGASDYLLKPLAPELVSDVIRQTYGRLVRWQQALAGTFSLSPA